jgi:hypothetical protein
MDLTAALAPKSDQLDYADLEGSAPQIFTITDVGENGTELADQQPVNIRLAEFPRVWRPSKGMLRVLADNWGKDVKVWVGRQVELYGDPNVYFGKEKRGGTRISRLSHISARKTSMVNPRGGRDAYWTVDPLPAAGPPSPPVSVQALAELVGTFDRKGIPEDSRLSGVNAITGGTATDLEGITEAEAQQVLAKLAERPDVTPTEGDPA